MVQKRMNSLKGIIATFLMFIIFGQITGIIAMFPNMMTTSYIISKTPIIPFRPYSTDSPSNSDQIGDEWPMYQGNLAHTGTAMTNPVIGTKPIWNYTTGNHVYSTPAISGELLYVGSEDHNIYCLNASSGLKIWNYTTGNKVESSPAIANDCVYIGSDDHNIYCLNGNNGSRIWNYTTGNAVESSPAVANGYVYVGSEDDLLYCLNATTGTYTWNYTTGNNMDSSPAISGGFVFVGSDDDNVYCLNASTGDRVWNYTTGSAINSSPTVEGGFVYIGGCDGNFYCLNDSIGTKVWNYSNGWYYKSSPAIANGCVYIGNNLGLLFCFNSTSGVQIWNCSNGNTQDYSPAVANGYVYVFNAYYMDYLNATSGLLIWNLTMSNFFTSSPAIADGCIYIGSLDFNVYCLPMQPATFPAAPQLTSVIGGNNKVTLTWASPVNNGGIPILNYTIYRSSTTGAESSYITLGNVTSYVDTNVTNGQTVYYKISAINGIGKGSNSTEMFATPGTTPSGPVMYSPLSGDDQIFLNWSIPANNGGSPIINYSIYRGTSSNNETFYLSVGNTTTYLDTGLTSALTYYYEVSAYNIFGGGMLSNEVHASPLSIPSAPQNLTATLGNGQVLLTWTMPANTGGLAITNIKIYRGNSSGNDVLVATLGNVLTWTDTGLTNGQTYYYMISAVNSLGEGALSPEINSTPSAPPTSTISNPINQFMNNYGTIFIGVGIFVIIVIIVGVAYRIRNKRLYGY